MTAVWTGMSVAVKVLVGKIIFLVAVLVGTITTGWGVGVGLIYRVGIRLVNVSVAVGRGVMVGMEEAVRVGVAVGRAKIDRG